MKIYIYNDMKTHSPKIKEKRKGKRYVNITRKDMGMNINRGEDKQRNKLF